LQTHRVKKRSGRFAGSVRAHAEARRYLAGGVSSNFRLGVRPVPLTFARAEGSKLVDVDGNVYIDYALGLGPAILGHAPPSVVRAVADSLGTGQLYGGQHEAERLLAREICRLVPCAERVRFSLSGTEAIQAALRLARAHTGRGTIVKFEGHYHGWLDNIYASVHPSEAEAGPPDAPRTVPMTRGQDPNALSRLRVLPWNDPERLRATLEARPREIAAVIMEPIPCNTGVMLPVPGYLQEARRLCTRHGVILIFDEVITGFRVGLAGAQGLLGVAPDLTILAKALGAGFPISCLAGRAPLMERLGTGEVTHAGTYNSGVLSCVAARAALAELRRDGGAVYSRMERLGRRLMEGLREAAAAAGRPFLVQGLGTVFNTAFTDQPRVSNYRQYLRADRALQQRFVERLLERGVYITARGTWFLSAAHTQADIEATIEIAAEALRRA
jgi:glutamate-1-semialdehyde 2,1-aminomutase